MKLFISHKHDDSAVYSMVCMALDSVNMDRFDPMSMRAGESLDLQLKVAIQECDVCVFLATSRSIESKWCLAELGAFWGAGKTVIMFMVDPDLTDASLPPQFKGSLKASTAKDLIRSIQDHRQLKAQNPANLPPRFVRTAGEYGNDSDWASVLERTSKRFDIMGIEMAGWRRTQHFPDMIKRKVADGCRVRVLMVHPNNPALQEAMFVSPRGQNSKSVKNDLQDSIEFFQNLVQNESLSAETPGLQYRLMQQGYPHFSLTITDSTALMVSYFNSIEMGFGPLWQTEAGTQLYEYLAREFDYLWNKNEATESKPSFGDHD